MEELNNNLRSKKSLNVALLCVHYLLVLFNDNQMHGLITATDSEVGSGRGGADCKVTQGHDVYVCVYGPWFKKKMKQE